MKKSLVILMIFLFSTSAAMARPQGELQRILCSLCFHNEWSMEAQPLIKAYGVLRERGIIEKAEQLFLESLQSQEPTTGSTGSVDPTTGTTSNFNFQVSTIDPTVEQSEQSEEETKPNWMNSFNS